MIVCPSQKTSFTHIYKTGGTSLTRILSHYTDTNFRTQNPRYDGDGWQGTWHFRGDQHSKFEDNIDHLAGILDDTWTHLVICRNPYDWFASVFFEFYHKDLGWPNGSNFVFGRLSRNRTFEDFIDFFNDFKAGHPGYWGFSTQRSFVSGAPDKQIIKIKFENYTTEVATELTKLGFSFESIPHDLKRGSSKENTVAYLKMHPKFRAFVNENFSEDFEFFGYDRHE